MIRVFPNLANQPNKIELTICNSISRNCLRLMRDWKLESSANGKEICGPLHHYGKRGLPPEVVYNFRTDSPGKLLLYLTFNRAKFPDFFAKWWAPLPFSSPEAENNERERLGLNAWLPRQHVGFVVSHCGRHCDQTKLGVFSSYLPWRFYLFNFSSCLWQRITDTKSNDLERKI